jgi:hypothetical protein
MLVRTGHTPDRHRFRGPAPCPEARADRRHRGGCPRLWAQSDPSPASGVPRPRRSGLPAPVCSLEGDRLEAHARRRLPRGRAARVSRHRPGSRPRGPRLPVLARLRCHAAPSTARGGLAAVRALPARCTGAARGRSTAGPKSARFPLKQGVEADSWGTIAGSSPPYRRSGSLPLPYAE